MASLLLGGTTSTFALDTATIVSSAVTPNCLEYCIVGICYWLYCTWTGCTVRTSVKVRHYIPDAVVSSYANTGENPWVEVRAMSMPNPTAQAGGDGRHAGLALQRPRDGVPGSVDPACARSATAPR